MLKMFTTQLGGLFKKLLEKEEFAFEDAARLLAQAPVGTGRIFIFGTREMQAVAFEATEGAEPLYAAKRLIEPSLPEDLNDADRVLVVSRFADDLEALQLARALVEKRIQFVSVSSAAQRESEDTLAGMADVHVDLALTKGMLPAEDGSRFGFPSSMAALFVYYAIKFTIDEILEEYELE